MTRHRPCRFRLVLLVWAAALLGPLPARGEVVGFLEESVSDVEQRSAPEGEPALVTGGRFVGTRAGLTWTRRLWPNLSLQVGGLYEKGRFRPREDDGILTDRQRVRPEVSLNLQTGLWRGRLFWSRNEESVGSPGLPEFVRLLENRAADVGWEPEGLPRVRLQWYATEARDQSRAFQDTTSDRWSLLSEWQPRPPWDLSYSGSVDSQEDRLTGTRVEGMGHLLRVGYADTFGGTDRVALSADYRGNYRETEVRTTRPGEVLLPTEDRGLGLAGLPADPRVGALGPAPWLADLGFDRPPAGGFDLVTDDPADLDNARHFGLRFPEETTLDTLRVWADQLITADIASLWSWEVYVNADEQCTLWRSQAVLGPVPYSPVPPPGFASDTEGRFDLRFPQATVRCLKAVVRPIPAEALPPDATFGSVLVTELEGYRTEFAQVGVTASDQLSQSFNTGLRVRLAERVPVYYEMDSLVRIPDSGPTRWNLRNGVSATHMVGVWALSGRLTREDGEDRGASRSAHDLTLGVTANPLPTLQHSLVFNARRDEWGDNRTDASSVFYYGTAQVYRGVSASLGGGKSVSSGSTGLGTDALQATAGLVLQPHRTFSVSFGYEYRDTALTGLAERVLDTLEAVDASINWRPLSGLYLFAYARKEDSTTQIDRTSRQVEVGWAPFPYGALQLAVSYRQRSDENPEQDESTLLPTVRWSIRPGFYVNVSYQWQDIETEGNTFENDTATALLRYSF